MINVDPWINIEAVKTPPDPMTAREAASFLGVKVETGEFRAMMEVELVNDGPVTLLLDSERIF